MGSKAKDDEAGGISDRSSISSQEGGEGPSAVKKEKVEVKEELLYEIDVDVKGQKVANQPFDLAVDVNDSEEIDSDEEEDEVNVEVNPVN